MDGNGRYAQNLGKSRLYGHKMGVRRLWDILEATLEAGIPYLSVFAFSTENWQRPTKEVKGLFRIARSTVRVYNAENSIPRRAFPVHREQTDAEPKGLASYRTA